VERQEAERASEEAPTNQLENVQTEDSRVSAVLENEGGVVDKRRRMDKLRRMAMEL